MRGAGFLPGADLSMPTSTRASSASEQSHASRKLLKGLAPPPLFEPERTAEASASEHSPATAVLSRTGFVRGRRPDGPAALRIFPGRFAKFLRVDFAPARVLPSETSVRLYTARPIDRLECRDRSRVRTENAGYACTCTRHSRCWQRILMSRSDGKTPCLKALGDGMA